MTSPESPRHPSPESRPSAWIHPEPRGAAPDAMPTAPNFAESSVSESNVDTQVLERPRRFSLGKLAVAGLVLLCGFLYLGGGASDSAHANYSKHKDPAMHEVLKISPRNIDLAATARAVKAIEDGENVPEIACLGPRAREAVRSGAAKLVRLHLFDTCSEDGDVVRVEVDGTSSGEILLTNAGEEVFIPTGAVPTPVIVVHAVKDGQGGVTVGVQAGDGTWYSGVIPEGGTETVPLKGR